MSTPPIEQKFNILGYVPIIGTISGLCHIIYGIAKTAFAFYKSLVSADKEIWKAEIQHGIKQIHRGLIELVPFLRA